MLLMDAFTTIQYEAGIIELENSTDLVSGTALTLDLINDAGTWKEVSRTVI